MKRDMAEYILKSMKCQQVKVEHQHPAGLLHPLASSGMEMGSYFHGFYYRIVDDLETT